MEQARKQSGSYHLSQHLGESASLHLHTFIFSLHRLSLPAPPGERQQSFLSALLQTSTPSSVKFPNSQKWFYLRDKYYPSSEMGKYLPAMPRCVPVTDT
ncbi:hypothetical protein SRHO_G00108830 [Serrasalmus rhombeus]